MAAINRDDSINTGVGVFRSAATGATVAGLVFILCWLGAALSVNGAHTYIGLFTTASDGSFTALWTGLGASLLVGALIGALTAIAYNAFSFLAPG
ncbi:hypothetical protein [uncultured Phenylobacterium sp.]|uniref:hypothetical protein n=1 Tax=uncultured Phenylobacterium sp. TaxID=349273 RepID=UPI0025EE0514|nr:hypothetical protein [uncultured Phenylobacterium sp.]